MNTKLFLMAFSLIIINAANIGYSMNDGYGMFKQEQPRTTLDFKQQTLDEQINEFAAQLMNNGDEKNLIYRAISTVIQEIYNKPDVMDAAIRDRDLTFRDILITFHNTSSSKRIYKRIESKDLQDDEDLYILFTNILESKQEIEYLKEHPEKNK